MNRLFQDARSRYLSLDDRERWLVLVLAIFLLVLLAYSAVLAPAARFHDTSREALQQQRELNHWLREQQPLVASLGETSTPDQVDQGNSLTLVNSSARRFQLTIKRVQPENDGEMRVWMDAAGFENLLRWLHHLQQRGMGISEINLDQNSPGKVDVRATISTL